MIRLDNERTKAYESCFAQLNCEITLPVVRKEINFSLSIKLNVKRVSYVDRQVPRNQVPRFVLAVHKTYKTPMNRFVGIIYYYYYQFIYRWQQNNS